ncbi:hypothetical protein MSG28_015758 [Choristoneura fumiferana]|uniref:Uncharacterized protein n=1 Tax=Choristoneura fumiferana TaxID=7141 RepID=A0ACC0KBE2_CHOFU|nr:hypothetical protein MSG28_015758 [Choristoneura fumiferana]
MPSKKRKYNARFPAGRIKKIMQTDEEVGKVAQAVPIIISRTLELFVESLLSKAMRVTAARNAKTLSPSHVKQCILAEARFDFLRDLFPNILHRLSDTPAPPRRLNREDSSSSSSSEVRPRPSRDLPARSVSLDPEIHRPRVDVPATIVSTDTVIDLSLKPPQKTIRTANFYQETLPDEVQHHSVITPNPTYASPQPSTSNYANLTPVQCRVEPVPKPERRFFVEPTPTPPLTPVTPVINIDFTKSLAMPEIKVLGATASNIVPNDMKPRFHRQVSKNKEPIKKVKPLGAVTTANAYVDLDNFNTGNLQIDEDYDT